jgi:hypothetical protein
VFYEVYAPIHYAYFIERDLISAVSTEYDPSAEVRSSGKRGCSAFQSCFESIASPAGTLRR